MKRRAICGGLTLILALGHGACERHPPEALAILERRPEHVAPPPGTHPEADIHGQPAAGAAADRAGGSAPKFFPRQP